MLPFGPNRKDIDIGHRSNLRYALRRLAGNRDNLAGAVIILVFLLTSLLAPLISPYDPNKIDLGAYLQGPSREHLMGTDRLGRDLLSRIIHGGSVSMMVGLGAVGFSLLVGSVLGMAAGYLGGWVSTAIMRFMDALWALPSLILALSIATVLGTGSEEHRHRGGDHLHPGLRPDHVRAGAGHPRGGVRQGGAGPGRAAPAAAARAHFPQLPGADRRVQLPDGGAGGHRRRPGSASSASE